MKAYNSSLQDKERLFGQPTFPHMTSDEFGKLFRAFILERLSVKTKQAHKKQLLWIGEKDPDHAINVRIMMRLFPNASFIHIIRDPRDAAVSWWHHMYRYDSALAGTRNPDFETACLKYGREWSFLVRNVREHQRLLKARYHEVRYERLVEHPHESLRQLFEFLSAPSSDSVLSSCLNGAEFSKLSGGRQRGEEDSTSFFRKAIVGDWKNHMSQQFEDQFTKNVGKTFLELGYCPCPSRPYLGHG